MQTKDSVPAADRAIAAEAANLRTLEHVLAWMERRNLLTAAVDLVAQDEFHSDFLVEFEPGRWLVFAVT